MLGSPPSAGATSRQEVSELIGSGQSSVTRFRADGVRRRAARAGRPLARKTSAGTGRKRRDRAARFVTAKMLRCHPESAVDVAEGAPTPSGGFLPVQRKLDALHRTSRWGSGGPTVVLAGCSGCRSRRAALGLGVPSQRAASSLRIRLGLAILPRARVVKGRRKPVPRWKHRGPGDRLLKSRVLPPGEAQAELGGGVRSESFGRRKLERDKAALVEGRRPGSNEVIAFDEAAAEVGSGGVSWARPKVRTRCDGCDRGRQRLCTRARCAEDNAATGRLSAEELRPMLHQDRAGSSLGSASGLRSCMPAPGSRCYAEAGASSSSEAPSEDLPEAIGTATVRER